MNEPGGVESIDREPLPPRAAASHPRAIGSPLPMGASRRAAAAAEGDLKQISPAPPGRGLPGAAPAEDSSGMQRAVNAIRMVLPLLQRLLPLIDGNIGAAVSSLLAARPHPPAPAPKIDLGPLEERAAELQTQYRNLRDQIAEQNTSLRRVEDQLEMVREATDRNTLEQQELLEDLKNFGNKVRVFAIIGIVLLAASFLLNLILFLHIQRVLP